MALDTYSALQTSIANWADRDDLTAFIPDFIALTEARFNRALRLRSMEQSQTATTVAGQSKLRPTYELPTDERVQIEPESYGIPTLCQPRDIRIMEPGIRYAILLYL